MVESVFWPRLRWRMRGAWQWPVFGVLTVADAVLVMRLPFHGDGPDAAGAFLLAGFFNLLMVAVGAPLLGLLLRRRRPDLPRMIARDYAGTALLVLVTLGLVAAGLVHRPVRHEQQVDRASALVAVHQYIRSSAPRYRGAVDLVQEEPDLYRACVTDPARPSRLPLCLYVSTSQVPAGVTRDPSREPNRHN
jgi:hypothetical protein